MSTKIHDATKAREQNLSLFKEKNMKKKGPESVRNDDIVDMPISWISYSYSSTFVF